LSIVGSEMLPQLPFECLPLEGQPLGERFALDHWPGVAFVLARAEAPAGRGPLRLALFGTVRRDAGEAGLGSTYVAPLLEGYDRPIVHLEDRCRLADLTALGATDVLVLMAHGERRRELVRPIVLRLHDGIFTCDDVARLPAPRVVVLAACNAALGPNRFGAPLRADLGGAFLEHGAGCVAASPFALRLEPTRRLLTTTLQLLRAGVDPAEALRRSRVKLAEATDGAQAALDRWTTAALAVFGHGQRGLR
ncbi:MAG: CHAT domain-containing protein, partial [Planctomycetes bacterium]|nr:CHAT domain-containing protein [Planctomycetota bacterium]